MENYFILLGLSFDPIESNDETIKQAIEAKREQWQKEAKNPRKQIQAKNNIAKIPEIQEIMLNPSKRKVEAEKAQKILSEYINNLKNEILLLSVKGYIEQEEYNNLVNKYSEYSIKEETIYNLLTVPIESMEINFQLDDIESIPSDIASQFEVYFNNLGLDDISIYNLYNLPSTTDTDTVINTAQAKLKEMLEKGSKDNKDEIEQKIAGLIINLFKDNNSQTLYNNYLTGFRYLKLNELIKTAVSKNQILTLKAFQTLLSIIENTYNIDKSNASKYIITNCIISKYQISQDVIIELEKIKNNIENTKVVLNIEKEEINTEKEKIHADQEMNTSQIINNMLTPINTILIDNKNKTNQITSYLNQYKQAREENGSAMSSFLSYGTFVGFGVLTLIDLILIFLKVLNYGNPLVLLFSCVTIIANIISVGIVYPPYTKWNKMKICVFYAEKNNNEQIKLYDNFIKLNFNLLIEDNKKIIKDLEKIKQNSENLLKDTKKQYAIYTKLSKSYKQSMYQTKILLGSIAFNIIFLGYIMFFI